MVWGKMVFAFRLQKVLNYRLDQKKLAREELSYRQRELASLREELNNLQLKEDDLLDFYRGRQAEAIDVHLLRNIESYRSHLQDCTDRKQQECRESCDKVEEQREIVTAFWKGCRMLESLQEKCFTSYQQEEKIREQRFHDELSLRQYLQKKY